MRVFIFLISITLLLLSKASSAQLISAFNWDSGSAITAITGFNANSVSSSAAVTTGGKGGTNGLNPGTPKNDLNLTLTGSDFNVDGIDISIDYQREEAEAQFFSRGSSLVFGMTGGSLYCNYRVSDGGTGYVSVNSGAVYSIPNDDIYRTYRFTYVPETGDATIKVDGVSQWTNNGTDNRKMYWTSSGNMIIGALMDGSGNNKACLDNMSVTKLNAPLPVSLISFVAIQEKKSVELKWITASEENNNFFSVERSKNGKDWEMINQQDGAGNSNIILNYSYSDLYPLEGTSYYRLKQIDYNGSFSYSDVRSVNYKNRSVFTLYPNPANDQIKLRSAFKNSADVHFAVINSAGEKISVPFIINDEYMLFDISRLQYGFYHLIMNNRDEYESMSFEKM